MFSSRLVKSKKCRGGEGGLLLSWSLGKRKLSGAVQCGGRGFGDTPGLRSTGRDGQNARRNELTQGQIQTETSRRTPESHSKR